MHRRSGFPITITVAIFILTWSLDFTVEGVPSRRDQCQQRGYEVACQENNAKINRCEVLNCGRKELGHYVSQQLIVRGGLPDETACGQFDMCINRMCFATGEYVEGYNVQFCKPPKITTESPIKTREQQCQAYGFDVACVKPRGRIIHNCDDLHCGYKISDDQYIKQAMKKLPIELIPTIGSWCDVDKACYKRQCIPLSKWPSSIPRPTYTGSESFRPCNVTKI